MIGEGHAATLGRRWPTTPAHSGTVRYCVRCLFPETKPDLSIDENGVCDACRSAEDKQEIDWDARRRGAQGDPRALPLAGRLELRLRDPGLGRQGLHLPGDAGPGARVPPAHRDLVGLLVHRHRPPEHREHAAARRRPHPVHAESEGLPRDLLRGLPPRRRRLLALPRRHLQLSRPGRGELPVPLSDLRREPPARVRRAGEHAPRTRDRPAVAGGVRRAARQPDRGHARRRGDRPKAT